MEGGKLDFSVDVLTDAHKKEMEKHAGFDQGTIEGHYDEVCANYEAIYLKVGFPDPKKCQELTSEFYQLTGKSKEECEILDMGSGTGLVGQYLTEDGFKNITGVDASEGMLKECEATKPGVYKELKKLFLGKPDTFPEEHHDKYDVVTGSGILADNHLDNSVFEEMLLSLKKGGIACVAVRTEYLEKYAYGPYMKKLEDEGKWKFIKSVTFTKYDQYTDRVGRFTPTESQALCYQKL